ncbi:response regulator transcription factor [Facklamia miroungae]|uniref:DNA-binding response regulator, OmpR family, contains REC and winged-helix (WHTH) domain n=1 Tax=Facklamia miroungae TaxID=120956 RepID=A0A1G7UJ37_9LACT|nr:response regulator transcription factor [Facklamia miroungae]NKZ30098.1 response regulator transcription factor [Facklamia miroungae]SDG47089.1 DNA-binding response regulator, OmpR family, contains REC and winged-helix (wHTH) domain [Facklamia miroungae]
MVSILVVEDDLQINNMLLEALTKEGYLVTPAYSGSEGQLLFELSNFDLILLDLMLPGLSGLDLLKIIRGEKSIPVIVISAKEQVDDKVELLQAGADDYLVKPFDLKELKARIQVCLKRHQTSLEEKTSDKRLNFEGLMIDFETRAINYQGQELNLTPQERRILELLLSQPKKVFSKFEIYEYAWGADYLADDKTLTVHMSNLRKKLNQISKRPWIETVWGIGFRLISLENKK